MSDSAGERWTPEQRHAIEARGSDILVSAGAGSGKTSVLVERVIRRLMDPERPIDVDRILVVTFTESAAAEMRERIRLALLDQERGQPARRAASQLALLGKAAISTLHGFCLQVLRRHFYVLGLDPRFTVAGEDEARLLKLTALDRVFESMHRSTEDEETKAWQALVEHYGGPRDDRTLREIVLQLFEYVQSLPEGERWLEQATEAYERGSPKAVDVARAWQAAMCNAAARDVQQALSLIGSASALASLDDGPHTYLKSFAVAKVSLDQALQALRAKEWDRSAKALRLVEWPRLSAPKGADQALQAEARALWDQAKKRVRRWSDGPFTRPLVECMEEISMLHPVVAAVCDLVRSFGHEYRDAKRRQALVDFGDLERFSLEVLQADDGRHAAEYRARFHEVMVDEYQDINPVQDRLLSLLARSEEGGGNRFLVGDVKQSIYRFRLADPTIFQEKFHLFAGAEDDSSTRIDLQANFRSAPYILNSVNFLFRQVMHRETGGIHYGPEAFLRSGLPQAENVSRGAGASEAKEAVEVHLIDQPARSEQGGAEFTSIEREAVLVGRLIQELVPASYRFRDVAVLMRSPKGRAGAFVEALEGMGIPAYTRAGTGFFKAVEVDVTMSLLRLLDNARQDIPLAAVLRSPIVGLSSHDLAQIRAARADGDFYDAVVQAAEGEDALGRRLAHFVRTLDRWRTEVRRLPLSQMLRQLYNETGYLDFVAGLPRAEQREANLWGLYHRAQQFDHFRSEGLGRFLRFVDDLQEAGNEVAPPPSLGEGEDVVQIMSVHQSKGLEFPVVILVDLDRGFNKTDTRRSFIFHRELGIGAAVIDRARHLRYPSLAHRAVAEQLNQDTLEEELRLFYVAATRAKERMLCVAAVGNLAERCAAWAQSARVAGWELPAGDVLGAGSWLDWLGCTLARHRDGLLLRSMGAGDLGADFYEPADDEVRSDPAHFELAVWSAHEVDEWLRQGRQIQEDREALPIEAIGRRESVDVDVPGALRATLDRRFDWRYPSEAPQLPAKISVTEFARLLPSSDEEVQSRLQEPAVELRPAPTFASGRAGERLSAAERGSAVHRFLALGNLGVCADPDRVKEEVRRLVDSELLTSLEAEAIDPEGIARAFGTPLGRRVGQAHEGSGAAQERLQRELPFTMLYEASILAGLAGDASTGSFTQLAASDRGEKVLVQGTIDALLSDGPRYVLIDYKTDGVAPGEEDAAAVRYRGQLRLYAEFVRRAFLRAKDEGVVEAYLLFLATGRAVAVAV